MADEQEKQSIANAEAVTVETVTAPVETLTIPEHRNEGVEQQKRELLRDPMTGKFAAHEKTKRKAERLQRQLLKMITSKRPGQKQALITEALKNQLEYIADHASEKALSGSAKVIEVAAKVSGVTDMLKEEEPNSGIRIVHIPPINLMNPEVLTEEEWEKRNRKPLQPSFIEPVEIITNDPAPAQQQE